MLGSARPWLCRARPAAAVLPPVSGGGHSPGVSPAASAGAQRWRGHSGCWGPDDALPRPRAPAGLRKLHVLGKLLQEVPLQEQQIPCFQSILTLHGGHSLGCMSGSCGAACEAKPLPVKQESMRGARVLPSGIAALPQPLCSGQRNVLVRETPPCSAADLAHGSGLPAAPLLIAWLRFTLLVPAVPHTLSLSSSYHGPFSSPSLPGAAGRATSLLAALWPQGYPEAG